MGNNDGDRARLKKPNGPIFGSTKPMEAAGIEPASEVARKA